MRLHRVVFGTLGLAGLGLAGAAAARRLHLPCPWWLGVLVENPLVEAVAGAGPLCDRAGVGRGMAVLDVGCGPGRLTLAAAERVGPAGRVVALDLQPRMIARVRRRAAERGLANVETVIAGAGKGAVPPASFDRAFLVAVLGEIADRRAAVTEIARALKPGGLLAVTELLLDPHFQPRSRVLDLASRAGLEPVASFGSWGGYTLHLVRPDA
jgi:ubiquinone/menaquinone biosynthesis C-methylase UbiE